MNDIKDNKFLLYLLAALAVVFIVGLLLYLNGLNLFFNYLFIDNDITFAIFSVITELGDTLAYLLIIVVAWYIYDKRFAKNLAIGLLSSYYLNNILKDIFKDPRPPTNYKANAEGFGFPSGHSQNGAAAWGYLAYEAYRKESKILFWIFTILIFLIAGSRLIIGVHDLQDVWGGLTIGFIWLILFILLEPKLSELINGFSILIKAILAIVIPLIIFFVAILIFPSSSADYGLISGGLIGLSLGYIIETEKIHYDPRNLTNTQRIINLVIGLVITLILYFGLSLLFPESPIMDLLQYFILSFLLVTLVPWIFTKIQRK
ncbi:MAG: phosphatase PAP2 family protein [Promethearchaeota archaeon]|nr:MAG: phosphatase PAP2 family protein [Candidatus Lokiarchaeota archaeon]